MPHIIVRSEIAQKLAQENPVLIDKELVVEYDTLKIKIGKEGVRYNDLPYITNGGNTSPSQVVTVPTPRIVYHSTKGLCYYFDPEFAKLSQFNPKIVLMHKRRGYSIKGTDGPADSRTVRTKWVQRHQPQTGNGIPTTPIINTPLATSSTTSLVPIKLHNGQSATAANILGLLTDANSEGTSIQYNFGGRKQPWVTPPQSVADLPSDKGGVQKFTTLGIAIQLDDPTHYTTKPTHANGTPVRTTGVVAKFKLGFWAERDHHGNGFAFSSFLTVY